MYNQSGDRETTQGAVDGRIVNLGLGHPGLSLLPVDLVGTSAARTFADADPRMLQYGYEQGAASFRRSLAGFLERATGSAVDPAHLFISGGVSQALDIISTLFARPGDLVLVEEPTYFLALSIFGDHGLRVQSVPTDSDGLDVEAVERILRTETPAFIYTVPVHQNPSGVTLSEARRKRLVELASAHDVLILADEVYRLLSYDEDPPESFGRYLDSGHVCALGSFSKILAPGLRMGWIHTSAEITDRIFSSGFFDSGGGVAQFTSALLQQAVDDGALETHINTLRDTYRERRDALLAALDGSGLRLTRPRGGYYVWAELPDGRAAGDLLPQARDAGVSFVPGSRFSTDGSRAGFVRLSFSYYEPADITEGVRRLRSVL